MNSGIPFYFFSSLFKHFSTFIFKSLFSYIPFRLTFYIFLYTFPVYGLTFYFSYFFYICKFPYDPNSDFFLTFLSNAFLSSNWRIVATVFFLLGAYFTGFSFSIWNSNSKLSLLSCSFSSYRSIFYIGLYKILTFFFSIWGVDKISYKSFKSLSLLNWGTNSIGPTSRILSLYLLWLSWVFI